MNKNEKNEIQFYYCLLCAMCIKRKNIQNNYLVSAVCCTLTINWYVSNLKISIFPFNILTRETIIENVNRNYSSISFYKFSLIQKHSRNWKRNRANLQTKHKKYNEKLLSERICWIETIFLIGFQFFIGLRLHINSFRFFWSRIVNFKAVLFDKFDHDEEGNTETE